MKLDALCEHIRTKNEPLRVDGVIIETGAKKFLAHGTLAVGKSDFRLRLAIENGEVPLPTGVYTPKDFWKISGVIDDETSFTAHGLPTGTESGFSAVPYSRAVFHVHQLSLVKEITEEDRAARKREIEESLRRLSKILKREFTEPIQTANAPIRLSHHARLIRYPLIWKNSGTETKREAPLGRKSSNSKWNVLHASFANCEFLLTQEGEDCLVDVFPAGEGVIESAQQDAIFEAFLWAIAFVNARDAWPQETKVTGECSTLKHIVTVPRDTSKSRSPLLNDTACANGADLAKALECATEFFLANPEGIAATVHQLLYLARNAASSSTPHEVGTLALCSIFEGIVDLLDGFHFSNTQSEDEAAFLDAKTDLLSACSKLKAALPSHETVKTRAYDRFAGMIGAAHFSRFKEKLPRLVAHYGLPWKGCFDLALASWHKHRNPLAHGRLLGCNGDELESQSRIAGAINLLMAAAMGYKGLAIFSSVEGKYQHI